MGFFKKIFGDAADELKKNFEESRNEMRNSLEEMKRSAISDFERRVSSSRFDDDDDDDDEPKIILGEFKDGVLTIREGITELDYESLESYKRIRKIVFPASLEKLESDVIDNQERLEELDFSKVSKLKEIPDDFISGNSKIRQFIIPNGVTEVGDGFLGDAESGTEVYVPASVKKIGYITGNNDNDMIVYLFAANIDIEDVEVDIKTLYVLPQYYAQYAKKLKACDSEARLCEMPDEKMNVYGDCPVVSATENAVEENDRLTEEVAAKEEKKEPTADSATLESIVQQIKEQIQSLGLSSFTLYANDYEGDREYEEVEQLGDKGLLESSSEYAINYNESYDGFSSVYTKVRKIHLQGEDVSFDIEEIYEDNNGEYESRGFHEHQTIDRILQVCDRDTVEGGLENILRYLKDETLIKLNSRTETDAEAKNEPVSGLGQEVEPANESEHETVSIEEPEAVDADNNGLFSARLEAMITAALQDGVLTDKERELLKRRAEKEGEDWDEVEMIIEARLAKIQPASTLPQSPAIENLGKLVDISAVEPQNSTPKILDRKISNSYKEEPSIIIPEGIQELDERVFSHFKMEEITLPRSLKSIGKEAFQYCDELRSIIIPDGIETIPENCFWGCKKLKDITFPASIKKIDRKAFYDCRKLSTLSIPMGCVYLKLVGDILDFNYYLPNLFLPPTLTGIDEIRVKNVYCFAPFLKELEPLKNSFGLLSPTKLYVFPQYIENYKTQAEIEQIIKYFDILPMPDEYVYFYDK